jgi:hypothetical protein
LSSDASAGCLDRVPWCDCLGSPVLVGFAVGSGSVVTSMAIAPVGVCSPGGAAQRLWRLGNDLPTPRRARWRWVSVKPEARRSSARRRQASSIDSCDLGTSCERSLARVQQIKEESTQSGDRTLAHPSLLDYTSVSARELRREVSCSARPVQPARRQEEDPPRVSLHREDDDGLVKPSAETLSISATLSRSSSSRTTQKM